jgi:hypothetical protein
MRHSLKYVNRCEASVGCCDCCSLFFICPVILEDPMTGQHYIESLQNELPEQLETVPLATRIAMYSQHDGAPLHYTRLVMQYLSAPFLIGGSVVQYH